MKRIGLFPGSFDPPSVGHLDIISRAAKLVDHLIVGVAVRDEKVGKCFLTNDQKVSFLRLMVQDISNVEVVSYEGLTVDFAAKNQVSYLIRGLRLTSPTHDEFAIALANRALSGLETIFILGDEQFSHVSSTIIRELFRSGGSLEGFVTPEIEKKMGGKKSPPM